MKIYKCDSCLLEKDFLYAVTLKIGVAASLEKEYCEDCLEVVEIKFKDPVGRLDEDFSGYLARQQEGMKDKASPEAIAFFGNGFRCAVNLVKK